MSYPLNVSNDLSLSLPLFFWIFSKSISKFLSLSFFIFRLAWRRIKITAKINPYIKQAVSKAETIKSEAFCLFYFLYKYLRKYMLTGSMRVSTSQPVSLTWTLYTPNSPNCGSKLQWMLSFESTSDLGTVFFNILYNFSYLVLIGVS